VRAQTVETSRRNASQLSDRARLSTYQQEVPKVDDQPETIANLRRRIHFLPAHEQSLTVEFRPV
jgi:hypothetical protein